MVANWWNGQSKDLLLCHSLRIDPVYTTYIFRRLALIWKSFHTWTTNDNQLMFRMADDPIQCQWCRWWSDREECQNAKWIQNCQQQKIVMVANWWNGQAKDLLLSHVLGIDPVYTIYVFRRLALIWKSSHAWTTNDNQLMFRMADDPIQSNDAGGEVKNVKTNDFCSWGKARPLWLFEYLLSLSVNLYQGQCDLWMEL